MTEPRRSGSPLPRRKRFTSRERWTLVGAMGAVSLVPLNSTMIAVGLPEIGGDLHVPRATAALLITSYLVAMALLQPFAGRIGDRLGSQRTLVGGLVGFSAASGLAAVAPSFPALLVARAVQAACASCLIPNVQAVLHGTVSSEHRGRAFGILGSGIGAGAAIGPLLGGGLVQVWGWRAIFLANAPVALGALVIITRVSPGGAARGDEHRRGWAGLVRRPFIAACVTQATSNLALYSVLLVVPLILEDREWSGAGRGLVLSGLTIGMLVLSPFGGALSDRRGRAYPVVLGMLFGVAGTAALATAGASTPTILVIGVLVLGVGMGLSSAPLQTAGLDAVDPAVAGSAAGMISTSRYIGSITGSLAIASLVGDGVDGIRSIFVITVIATCVAAAAATQLRPARSAQVTLPIRQPSMPSGERRPTPM